MVPVTCSTPGCWIEFPHQATKWTVQWNAKKKPTKIKLQLPPISSNTCMHESSPPPHPTHTPPAFGLKISPAFILPFAHLDIIFPSILNAAPSWSLTCFKLSLQPILPSRQKTLDIQDIKGKSSLKRSKCRMWTLLSPAPEILFSY